MLGCADVDHVWEPINGWVGRYRCYNCGVLGYRGITQPNVHPNYFPNQIFPYICKKSGCTKGAVRLKPKQVCGEHFRRPT